jgi:hypothetical protein
LNIALAGGNQTALFWPASATNVILQTTTNLSSPNWTTVTNGTPIIGVTVANTSPAAFFRLHLTVFGFDRDGRVCFPVGLPKDFHGLAFGRHLSGGDHRVVFSQQPDGP